MRVVNRLYDAITSILLRRISYAQLLVVLILMLHLSPVNATQFKAVYSGRGTLSYEDAMVAVQKFPDARYPYLAHITSASDNQAALDAITDALSQVSIPKYPQLSFWLGANGQMPSPSINGANGMVEPEGWLWYWSTGNDHAVGDMFTYSNWAEYDLNMYEPNNAYSSWSKWGPETRMTMYAYDNMNKYFRGLKGTWNDTPEKYKHDGFVYEVIPEPPTHILLLLGLGAFLILSWRRQS